MTLPPFSCPGEPNESDGESENTGKEREREQKQGTGNQGPWLSDSFDQYVYQCGGAVVDTVALQQEGLGFESQLGPGLSLC